MAGLKRSVLEVLKCVEAASVLKCTAIVSALWAAASAAEELWSEQMQVYSLEPEAAASKQQFRDAYRNYQKSVTVLAVDATISIFSFRRRQFVKVFTLGESVAGETVSAAVVSRKHFFVCGSDSGARGAVIVSLLDGSIERQPPMNTDRILHSIAAIGSVAYVFGGFWRKDLTCAESFDVLTHTWRKLPDMTAGRHSFAACTEGKVIYLCGGFTKVCEAFDTETEAYRQLPLLDFELNTLTVVYSGRLTVIARGSVYTLGESDWKERNLGSSLDLCEICRWVQMSASVYGDRAYVPVLGTCKVMEIDIRTLESIAY